MRWGCMSALQYSDWIVTPITGHYAESKGDFQHLGAYMDKCIAPLDYPKFAESEAQFALFLFFCAKLAQQWRFKAETAALLPAGQPADKHQCQSAEIENFQADAFLPAAESVRVLNLPVN